ncbi:hypothetical protein CBS101457_006694 [Exobasidium rhododendri]|nr:hypothetical protein CBS101457_006694 [Exobasidium rhododendri]
MTIASHSAGHPNMTLLTDDQVRFQIVQTNLYLNRTLGIVPRFFRFPYGSTDARVERILKDEFGMTSIFWQVATGDSDGESEAHQIAVVEALDSTSRDIILMHDTHGKSTIRVLKKILKILKKKQIESAEMTKCLGFYDPRDAYLYYKPHNNARDASWNCDNIPIGDPNHPVKAAKNP